MKAVPILLIGLLASTAPQAQTVTAVMQSGLRVMDPVLTTAYMTTYHGYMIYDTLLGVDEHFAVQPQMASWQVSDDGKIYTFTLRDGLRWHDGEPVTAEDCVASIARWAQVDTTGQVLMPMVERILPLDARRFEIRLNTPTALLLQGLSQLKARPLFMMPKRIAETPVATPITEYIGSGPFKFVASEFQPGLKVVYEKNTDYVPRAEPASWTAGGKVVNVDRVEWVSMPDPMTALNALQNDEIDFMQQVEYDLLPLVENRDDLSLEVLDKLGYWPFYRMNHLHPPFDNKLLRQAALAAVGQPDLLRAVVGNPEYYQTCAAILGCGTPFGDAYGEQWIVPADTDRARALLKKANYDGTPVVIMHPTDLLSTHPVVIAAALRKVGFNVTMKSMDWQTLIALRDNQKSPAEGGWNLFATSISLANSASPINNFTLSAAGRKSWAGWPDVPEIERLRAQFARTADMAEQKAIAAQLQKLAIDEGVVGPLGQYWLVSAYNARLSDVLASPVTTFWSLKKR